LFTDFHDAVALLAAGKDTAFDVAAQAFLEEDVMETVRRGGDTDREDIGDICTIGE
jgi:hypothetical protein